MPAKAIIIGAGPAGLTAAYELLEHTDIIPVLSLIPRSSKWQYLCSSKANRNLYLNPKRNLWDQRNSTECLTSWLSTHI